MIVYFELVLMALPENNHFIVAAGDPISCSTHLSVTLDPFNTVMFGVRVVIFGANDAIIIVLELYS